jgi:hypothetical protein
MKRTLGWAGAAWRTPNGAQAAARIRKNVIKDLIGRILPLRGPGRKRGKSFVLLTLLNTKSIGIDAVERKYGAKTLN